MVGNGDNDTDAAEVQSVNLKVTIPEFWPQNINLWFRQVEAQFLVNGIRSDNVKFNLLLAQLKPSVLTQVASVIENPPDRLKYDALKERIIEVYSESDQRRIRTLLSGVSLGDRRPSQLLSEQQQIGGKLISDQMLKMLWMNQLPTNIQTIVAANNGQLDDLAKIADKVWDLVPENQHISALSESQESNDHPVINQLHQPSASSNNFLKLESRVEELTHEINALRAKRYQPFNRPSGRRQPSSSLDNDTCWYHNEYGRSAKKCAPWCKFSSKNKQEN